VSIGYLQNAPTSLWYHRSVYAPHRPATTAPVEPVAKAPAVEEGSKPHIYSVPPRPAEPQLPEIRQGADPVEMAVRGRIRYLSEEEVNDLIRKPGRSTEGETAAPGAEVVDESKSPSEVMEEGECQTCKERKYQDGSDDPGVSFKTATRLTPEEAATAVRGHEMEHVVRERAKAEREDRRVVQQSVTLHNSICPECGKVYISGGVTRTVTKSDPEPDPRSRQGVVSGFEAVA